jgi:hypothetical protein
MDTRDPLRIGCPRCRALPGCFCKSLGEVMFTIHEERRLLRRRARGRKSTVTGPRENQTPSGAVSKSSTSKSIEGCLTNSNRSYTLGALSSDLYRLENSGHDLRKYNGQEVRITGRVIPPQSGSSPSNVLDLGKQHHSVFARINIINGRTHFSSIHIPTVGRKGWPKLRSAEIRCWKGKRIWLSEFGGRFRGDVSD